MREQIAQYHILSYEQPPCLTTQETSVANFRRATRLVDGEALTVQLLQETQVEDAARLLTETFARSLGYKPSQW